jgi:hypothetical protein
VRTLRSAPVTVSVVLSDSGGPRGAEAGPVVRGSMDSERVAAGVLLVIAVGAVGYVLVRRRRSFDGELNRIVAASAHTATLRKRLEESVTARGVNPVLLYGESSELGDAWRAAMSLADRIEKEPEAVDEPQQAVRARGQRLLEELERR